MIAISLIDEQRLYSVYSFWLTIRKAEAEPVLTIEEENSVVSISLDSVFSQIPEIAGIYLKSETFGTYFVSFTVNFDRWEGTTASSNS